MAVVEDLVVEVGRIGLWIQAIGLFVILWAVIQGVILYFNRKRRKLLEDISIRVKRIEQKLDKL